MKSSWCWMPPPARTACSRPRISLRLAGVTGIFLAKLDGTAKGGIALAICDQLKIPVKYIGVGEHPEDMATFDARSFVEALSGDGER